MNRDCMERAVRRFLFAALVGAAGAAAAAEYVNGARVDGAEPGEWTHDWDAATAAAKKDGKPVFVNFTGSDWCGWCKLLKRQVFTQPEWGAWASNHVYLVHLDFPNDKALVPEKYRERNRDLSRRYKVGGYPTCYLLDPATLEPVGRFGASRDANAADFIEKVSAAMPGAKSDAPARTESANRIVPRPTVTTNDFKAVLTGVAVVDRAHRDKADEAAFVPPETKVVVPYGKTVLFRVEYDFPEGYEARVWTRDGMCEDGKSHSWYFGSNPSGMFEGKGTAYGFLSLLDRGKACRVRELLLWTSAAPKLDNSPKEWTIATVPVDIEFLEASGTKTDLVPAGATPVAPRRYEGPGPAAPSAPWTFVPDEEGAALYWNGTISNGTVSLDARLAGGSAAVLFPEALSVPGGVLDLSTPIVDGSGAEVPLVGIGRDSDDSHVGFGGVRRMVSEIRLPATVQYLGPGAFERFLSLERFECPASVRCIGSAAFDGCRSLRTFRVGPAVESFSNDRVFMGCTALELIETDPANARYRTVDGALLTADGRRLVAFPPGRKGPFAVPAGVEAIPPRAFLGCEGLTRVSIPASVKKIGEFAFAGCTALERIEFEDTSFKLDDRVFGTPRPGEAPHRPATNLAAE